MSSGGDAHQLGGLFEAAGGRTLDDLDLEAALRGIGLHPFGAGELCHLVLHSLGPARILGARHVRGRGRPELWENRR